MKFVCDAMLGKLAKYLRILGLDAPLESPGGKISTAAAPDSIFLTRRKALRGMENTVFISSDRVRDQVRQIARLIAPHIDPARSMTRCINCNVPLEETARGDVESMVPEFVFHRYRRFRRCPRCGKVYWEGTHTVRMAEFVREILENGRMERGDD